eukprot:TRINITY_DN13993_c0_g1_i1.p1 TRINITY_DN13993_c0_g1~~TRINITY_DN13993_c0_g1_i1.p1  ORF type:complete len:379 (-),score=60.92 TRINITY_DN13993_c0_g1_i1:122-1258(-)
MEQNHGTEDWLAGLSEAVEEASQQRQLLESCVRTNEDPRLNKLCFLLEHFLFHGLKNTSLFGKTYYWDFVQHLDECLPDTVSTVNFVKGCARTSIGRGRVFICLGLNEKVLSDYLKGLAWNETLVSTYYHEWAVIRTMNTFERALEYCDRLVKEITFQLDVKDRGLDMPNYWNAWRVDLHQPQSASLFTSPHPAKSVLPAQPTAKKEHATQDQEKRTEAEPSIAHLEEKVQQLEKQQQNTIAQHDKVVLDLQHANQRIRELEDELQLYKCHITLHTTDSPLSQASSLITVLDTELNGLSPTAPASTEPQLAPCGDDVMKGEGAGTGGGEEESGGIYADEEEEDREAHVVLAKLHARGKQFLQELKSADETLLRTLEAM